MTTWFSILVWEIPRTEEPGRLQSMGSQRVRCDCVTERQQFKPLTNPRGKMLRLQSLWPGCSLVPWEGEVLPTTHLPKDQLTLKLMSVELVMPSSHLILCRPLLLLPPIPPSIRVFSNESFFA